MNVADLRKLLATLPDDMKVCMIATTTDELDVQFAETYPANPGNRNPRPVLMLCDAGVEDSGAGATVIWDERE